MREGVWTAGENTEFEAYVAEKSRRVVITRDAIDAFLEESGQLPTRDAADRRTFVSYHLDTMIEAAIRKTDAADQTTEVVTIDVGDL